MNDTESKQGAHTSNEDLQAATNEKAQITEEEFSKLSYRQKFAITEYEYLLSPEDAEELGKMLGGFAQEKDILSFCQEKGKKVYKSKIATKTNPLLIKIGDFFLGLFGWMIIHNLLFILLFILFGFILSIFNLISNSEIRVFLISLTIWVVVAIGVRVLFIKKRIWICIGVATTIVINSLCWVWSFPSWSFGEKIATIGLPFPLGYIFFLVG